MLLGPGSDCSTEPITVGSHTIYAWSDQLEGTACRSWGDGARWVRVDLDVAGGGYDVGIAYSESPIKISQPAGHPPINARLQVSLRGKGVWWAGPKFVVCQTKDYRGLEGNHECYIVETANRSPSEMESFFTGVTYLGQTKIDGSVYKHFSRPWEQWTQWIAIRQDYRESGSSDYFRTVEHWHQNLGLPDWYLHSPKLGLETYGQLQGFVKWAGIDIPSMTSAF